MGAVLSHVWEVYYLVKTITNTLSGLNGQYQRASRRVNNPPPAPSPNPSRPYWLDNPPFPDLVHLQDELPGEADIVVIGSGITGAAAARTLLELSDKPLKIVVVDARELCGGATGRNGGHIKVTPHEMFEVLRTKIGDAKARDVTRFQMRHLDILMQVGRELPVGEVREVETVDVVVGEQDMKYAREQVEEVKKWIPEHEVRIWEKEEAIAKFGINRLAAGAVTYKAGALWPYRLVTAVWDSLKKKHPDLIISTGTTVESITVSGDRSSRRHRVQTSRGAVTARHVLHATNAYSPYLVPSLQGRMCGTRAHMIAQHAGEDFPHEKGQRSWSIIHDPDFEYITQLPSDEKTGEPGLLMVGGGLTRTGENGLTQIGVWDDGEDSMDTLTLMHLRGSTSTVFDPRWGRDGGLVRAWSGITGFTGDNMPFVGNLGSVDGSAKSRDASDSGQWIAAGYCGEGMVNAWLCATAVAIMMLGKEGEVLEEGSGRPGGRLRDWFPVDEFAVTPARLKRADLRNLASDVM